MSRSMTEKTFVKETVINRTRTLADGTKKVYRSKVKYRVSDPNRVKNTGNEKLSPEQKEEAWQKHIAGVSIARIARDMKVSYSTAYKCIDKRKCVNGIHAPQPQ